MKKKISILVNSFGEGGTERVISNLLPYFEQKDVDVILVLIQNEILYNIPKFIKVEVLFDNPNLSNKNKILLIPIMIYKYVMILKRYKIDISISFLTRSNYLNLITKLLYFKPKYIINQRSNPEKLYGNTSFFGLINNVLHIVLFRLADKLLVNSEGLQEELSNYCKIDKNKIYIFNNPVNIKFINNEPEDNSFFDDEYFNIVDVGRLIESKNHKLLIDSVCKLNDKKIRLYIFGDGIKHKELIDYINLKNISDQIFIMGFQKNIYSIMKKADLFLFSSNHEGFPNVLLESMACNLPIISTNCPYGPAEVLNIKFKKNDKTTYFSELGILVPCDSLIDMVDAIRYIMNNPSYYKNIITNARKRVVFFSVENQFNNFFSLINN